MPCYRPLRAWKLPQGGVAFKPPGGSAEKIELPCGQCIGCRLARSQAWAIRMMHEAQMHDSNCFITLTYNDEHLPDPPSVDIKEWQRFAKSLRKHVGQFRYVQCGEYGDLNKRPHYHAAIFGQDFYEDRVPWSKSPAGHVLYRSPRLEKAWKKGHALIGELTRESAAYIARYVMKKSTGPLADEEYARVNTRTGEVTAVRPPFLSMSNKPGIGKSWYEVFKADLFPHDEVISGGKKFPVPRYYDNQLPEDELAIYKEKRRSKVEKRAHELTDQRLQTREEVCERTISTLKRKL